MKLKKKATWLWNYLLIWGGEGRQRKKVGREERVAKIASQEEVDVGGSLSKSARAAAEISSSIYTHCPMVARTGQQKN